MPGWYPFPDDEKLDGVAIRNAYETGDLEALRAALHDPEGFPNSHGPSCFGEPLLDAICSSPMRFIRELLEIGADPNIEVNDGFPSLITAAMSERKEKYEIVRLLLEFGANIQQRGVNGWFPLHAAVAQDDAELVTLLLEKGADPEARTNVDDYSTALEDAEKFGKNRAAEALKMFFPRR